jgi:hypothetical protein
MYIRPAIANNYRTNIYEEPKPRGLRNLIAWPENIGNLVFLNAIEDQIKNCKPVNFYDDVISRPEWFMENFDVLILPMANMISASWAIPDLIDVLKKYPIPINLLSVGVQANTKEDLKNMKLSDDAVAILNLAKERSKSIGVRGDITAEYLSSLGYSVDVIGCPSVFSTPLSKLHDCPREFNKIATHSTSDGTWEEGLKNLFEFSRKYAQAYLAQSELQMLVDRYNIDDATLKEWIYEESRLEAAKNRLYEYQYYSRTEEDATLLREWMKKSLIFFADTEEWKLYLSGFDLVVGARFHGTIMSILSGAPSLLLTTDLRTQELAEYHRIPHTPISTMTLNTTPEDLRQYVNFDPYWNFKNTAHMRYLDFLRKNGLKAR